MHGVLEQKNIILDLVFVDEKKQELSSYRGIFLIQMVEITESKFRVLDGA